MIAARAEVAPLARLRPLLGEVNDLKRIRVAGHAGSLAERGFARSWAALLAGEDASRVAIREAAASVVAVRLGGIDAGVLADAGLAPAEARRVFADALDASVEGLDDALLGHLRGTLDELADPARSARPSASLPPWVDRLAAQPRAGATRPGFPRLVLEPPENHAEHCYAVAVYGVLVAPTFGANPSGPFLAGLAHHLHNADLPDSGFAGEESLGDHLRPVMDRLTARALGQLPAGLAATVAGARTLLDHADTPEARSFHAADVLDRVLQMEQYARVAAFELRHALVDLDLVHPGPLQAFHQRVLAGVGLLP